MAIVEATAVNLRNKRKATKDDLDQYKRISDNRTGILVDDTLVLLGPRTDDDRLSDEERETSLSDNHLWDDRKGRPTCEKTPDTEDHRHFQTSIKHQLDRGTCVCFASLACLEAIHKRQAENGEDDLDLSEQYANWLYMGNQGRDQCADGLRTTLSASYLSQKGVCQDNLATYEDNQTVGTHCPDDPSQQAQDGARYGIGRYTIIDRLGLNGPSIANTNYLECLLSSGFDIVFGTYVAWGLPDPQTGVHDVLLDPYGNPLQSRGGHAMLVTGYVRNVATPYFVLKNSWGTGKGVRGYYYLSYDYIRLYSKYGYIVRALREDM